jgi:hypothetical protein
MGQIGASQADLQWIDRLASKHAVTRADTIIILRLLH